MKITAVDQPVLNLRQTPFFIVRNAAQIQAIRRKGRRSLAALTALQNLLQPLRRVLAFADI